MSQQQSKSPILGKLFFVICHLWPGVELYVPLRKRSVPCCKICHMPREEARIACPETRGNFMPTLNIAVPSHPFVIHIGILSYFTRLIQLEIASSKMFQI
jgi:hypothetical protein